MISSVFSSLITSIISLFVSLISEYFSFTHLYSGVSNPLIQTPLFHLNSWFKLFLSFLHHQSYLTSSLFLYLSFSYPLIPHSLIAQRFKSHIAVFGFNISLYTQVHISYYWREAATLSSKSTSDSLFSNPNFHSKTFKCSILLVSVNSITTSYLSSKYPLVFSFSHFSNQTSPQMLVSPPRNIS